jgi:hypothetical protein
MAPMQAEIRSHFATPIVVAALPDAAERCGCGNEIHTHPRGDRSSGCDVRDGGIGEDASRGSEFETQDPRGVAQLRAQMAR